VFLARFELFDFLLRLFLRLLGTLGCWAERRQLAAWGFSGSGLDLVCRGVSQSRTLSIVGVYSDQSKSFPIGMAMNKNLTIQQGNCHHRRYIPELLKWVRSGALDPSEVLTQVEPMTSVLEADKAFDRRAPGWIKVKLEPGEQLEMAV
jgi:threonine dehydrogenase-like Zn-dependent dehydrogenase